MKKIITITLLTLLIYGCGCLEKESEWPGCILPCDNGPCKN